MLIVSISGVLIKEDRKLEHIILLISLADEIESTKSTESFRVQESYDFLTGAGNPPGHCASLRRYVFIIKRIYPIRDLRLIDD